MMHVFIDTELVDDPDKSTFYSSIRKVHRTTVNIELLSDAHDPDFEKSVSKAVAVAQSKLSVIQETLKNG